MSVSQKIVCLIVDWVLMPVSCMAWLLIVVSWNIEYLLAISLGMLLGCVTAIAIAMALVRIFRVAERP